MLDDDDVQQESGKDYFWRCLGTGLMVFFISVGIGSCMLLSSITSVKFPG